MAIFDHAMPATGSGSSPNFSIQHILDGVTVTIPSTQQMVLLSYILIEPTGTLVIEPDASLAII